MAPLIYHLLPTFISVIGATFSAVGTVWKAHKEHVAAEEHQPAHTRPQSIWVFGGALLVIVGTLWSGLNQHASSIKDSELKGQLVEKSEELLKMSSKVDEKTNEIVSLNQTLVGKSEAIASLNRELAETNEENSETRKRDLETREITIERLIRTVATACADGKPDLQKQLDSIHNEFQRTVRETLPIRDSVTAVPAPQKPKP